MPPGGGNAYNYQAPKSGKSFKGSYILVHTRRTQDILLLINQFFKVLIFESHCVINVRLYWIKRFSKPVWYVKKQKSTQRNKKILSVSAKLPNVYLHMKNISTKK